MDGAPQNEQDVENAFMKTFRAHEPGVVYYFDSGNEYTFCRQCKGQYYLKIVDRRSVSSRVERMTSAPCPKRD